MLYVMAIWKELVSSLLLKANEKDDDSEGDSPLHLAVSEGNVEMARFLLDHGADLEARNGHGWTPLCSVIRTHNCHTFEFLLSLGADFNAKACNDYTVLHLIVIRDLGPTLLTCLSDPVHIDPRTLFSMKNEEGDTSLHMVLSIATAKCLVEHGFDPSTSGVQSTWMCPTLFSTRNNEGNTPHGECATKPVLREAVAKYLDSFESLPLVDLTTMKLSTDMNDFQRFLARRIYYTTLRKLPPGQHVAVRIMAFLSPADVMK